MRRRVVRPLEVLLGGLEVRLYRANNARYT